MLLERLEFVGGGTFYRRDRGKLSGQKTFSGVFFFSGLLMGDLSGLGM